MCQVPEGEVRETARAAGVGGRVTGSLGMEGGGVGVLGGDNDIRCRRILGRVDCGRMVREKHTFDLQQ